MTRYAIDAATAIRLVRERITVSDEHQLVAPHRLRSEALSVLYRSVRRGELNDHDALALLDGITTMRIRLLGDRVSRAVAWRIAAEHDWEDTARAEYVAIAQLQADAFITDDADLAHAVAGIVTLAPFEALSTPAQPLPSQPPTPRRSPSRGARPFR
ncbi:hypothetical protein GCM10022381_38120 [Leifsonia kafniensis]|uniref:PIN domain-containing protein n=1 Tax=Leifsonia kafniensis TaxID=475957 RepID=A0ABP7L2P2_9MICO